MAKKKSLIVIEGDSWERLPNFGSKPLPIVGGPGYDLGRALVDLKYPTENVAYWGDTIAEIARLREYYKALKGLKAEVLLLGGGGNDLLADGRLQTYLKLYDKDRPADQYLKSNFQFDLDAVMSAYEMILRDIYGDPDLTKVQVIVHGYDYARPMRLGWLGNPMAAMGITEFEGDLQKAIVKQMIDAFNDRLRALATRWKGVTYVDFRGMVGDRWHDELHPKKDAFADLAAHLVKTAGL